LGLLELCDPARKALPPIEYDHPFLGRMLVIDGVDQAQTKLLCAMQTVINPVFGARS